jgi:hypothetical protein
MSRANMANEANDWEVQGVCQVGGGAGFAAGIWVFRFWSADADFDGYFTFQGIGLGVGGSVGGANIPMTAIIRQLQDGRGANPIQDHEDNWSNLKCENKFSASQLNLAAGRLTTVAAGAAVQYGYVWISAGAFPRKTLFLNQGSGGFGTGVGATVDSMVGLWKFLT